MKKVDYAELREKFGEFEFDGRKYVLLEDAREGDGRKFEASALCPDDEPDEEDESIPVYRLEWEVPDGAESPDEIDWDEVSDAVEYDRYDLHEPTERELKWKKVRELSGWSRYPTTWHALLEWVDKLPDSMLDKLDPEEIASLIDLLHDCYHEGDMTGRSRNER